MRPRSLRTLVTCQNPHCGYYLRSNGRDIVKRGRNRAGNQRFQCMHCGRRFVETRGTPVFHRHLSAPEICNICRHLANGKGIRFIERTTGRHRDTIRKLVLAFSSHPEATTKYLFDKMRLNRSEIEAFWRNVGNVMKKFGIAGEKDVVKN